MSENQQPAREEDLLAGAIPIDPSLLEDDDLVIEEEDLHEAEVIEDDDDDLTPIEVAEGEPGGDSSDMTSTRIQMFGKASTRHADNWNRTPNATGTGAIHVKTFVAKLRLDAIDHLDEQVNEWLDAHPEYEVKMVTTSIGKLVGKISEDAIFMNVWV